MTIARKTIRDKDGVPVKYTLIGLTPEAANALKPLTLDTIANKKLIASYLEDISRCKTEIYEVDGNPNRLLRAQIFDKGSEHRLLHWFTLKKENGEDRYYFEDDDEGNYMVYETAIKTVHFRNGEGKEWQTFISE